ncbi:MAG TPA: NnrS family protein [Rhodocyclaceae bacterium]
MKAPILFAAPHRVMFVGGSIQALLAMAAWGLLLALRQAGLAVPALALPPLWLHALFMIYGVFSFFILGFIFTAGPRWQGAGELAQSDFLPAFCGLAGGWAMVWLGLFWPLLLAPGLVLVLAGWLWALRVLWKIARAPRPDRRHIYVVCAAHGFGALGLLAALALALGGSAEWSRWMVQLGLFGYLLPVFFTVTHRMLPFFSSGVIRNYRGSSPDWALWAMLAACLGHGALDLADLPRWRWLVDAPAAGLALWLSWRWELPRSFAASLVAVLHLAFFWLGIAWLLFALQSLLWGQGGERLGLAPLHALSLGFFASMLIGMASRVARGHSGLPVVGDRVLLFTFGAVQAAAVLRVAAEFGAGLPLALAAALLWLAAFAAWFLRYGPPCWRPRADGRPG